MTKIEVRRSEPEVTAWSLKKELDTGSDCNIVNPYSTPRKLTPVAAGIMPLLLRITCLLRVFELGTAEDGDIDIGCLHGWLIWFLEVKPGQLIHINYGIDDTYPDNLEQSHAKKSRSCREAWWYSDCDIGV